MSQVASLLNEVEQEAAGRNSEVIQAAFGCQVVHCPNCQYPNNHWKFEYILSQYDTAKIRLHRIHRSEKKYWYFHAETRAQNQEMIHERLTLEYEVTRLRSRLKEIWPCEDCIKQYNPTQRRAHPPKSLPRKEEFLDV